MDLNQIAESAGAVLKGDAPLYLFLGIVAFDIVTGYLKSVLWGVTDSSVGKKGLAKHITVVVGVCAIWIASSFLNVEFIGLGVTTFYSLNYAISILENLGVMGIPYPKFLEVRIKTELQKYQEQKEAVKPVETQVPKEGTE